MNRLEILAKIDHLTDQHCKPCPDKPHRGRSVNECKGCPIYDEFREYGDQLEEMTRVKREAVPMECTKENYQMLRSDGLKMNEIAERFGISQGTLYNRKNDWFSLDAESKKEVKTETKPSKSEVKESQVTKRDGEASVNSDVKSKYIDQISNLNKQISSQREEHQKLMNDYEELSQQYAAAVKDKDEAVKQLNELQASKIDVDAMRSLLKSLL